MLVCEYTLLVAILSHTAIRERILAQPTFSPQLLLWSTQLEPAVESVMLTLN